MVEYPKEGDEIEVKYKIKNYKGEIIDSTEEKPNFKFTLGKTNIIKSIKDNIKAMTKGSKKTIDINIEQEPNIFDIFSNRDKYDLENLSPNSNIVKCELQLINFHQKIKSIFELTNDEKLEKAKNMKLKFVEEYKNKNYKEAIIYLDKSKNYIEKISSKDYKIEEIKKFKLSILLNKCNCYNNLKDYSSTIKLGKEIIEMDDKSIKVYYYLGVALAYLDEFDEAMKNYNKLFELIPDKNESGLNGLLKLINTRKKNKEDKIRRKYKAYFNYKEK